MTTASPRADAAILSNSHRARTMTTATGVRNDSQLPVTRGWYLLLILPPLTFWLTAASFPPWAAMWLICGAVYAGCKWLTWRRTPALLSSPLPTWQHAAYLLAWPGLDAPAFLKPRPNPKATHPSHSEWIFACAKLTLGGLLFWIVPRTLPTDWELLRGWTGMIGIVFVLHFGLFHLLSCVWRTAKIDAQPLMDWPIASTSVSEFWGRRWNRAFRDLTHRFLFRPLTHLVGAKWGLAAGFLFSGLVHELAITVPAGGGYGGPTIFFGIQALALLFERSVAGRRLGLGREHSITGWVFTLIVLVLPAGLLFPPPFIHRIILPLMNLNGA